MTLARQNQLLLFVKDSFTILIGIKTFNPFPLTVELRR